jgi:hypothetical protein
MLGSDHVPQTYKRGEIPFRPLFVADFLTPRAPVSCAFFCPKMILTLVLAALHVEASSQGPLSWHVAEEVYVALPNR